MRRLLALILLIAFAGACSGGSPSAPSSLAGSTGQSAGGATVTGAVAGLATGGGTDAASSSLRTTSATGSGGVTVTVVGTGITTTVDVHGRFTLTNVPAGTIQLQFTGPGFSGTLILANVLEGETIELTVTVQGDQVSLTHEQRAHGSALQLEGRVEGFPDSPPGAFIVAGRTVLTDDDTTFLMGSRHVSFDELEVGQRVHIQGSESGDDVLAGIVDIQNLHVDLPVNVNGVISGFTGTMDSFMFMVDGREVHGDDGTVFFGNTVFEDLADGVRVIIKGLLQDNFVYAARLHVAEEDEGEDDDEDENEDDDGFRGELTSISGTVVPLTLVIDGRTVTVTAATEIRRRGDRLTPEVLQVGMTLEVTGSMSGGVFVVKKLTIDENTFDVDIEGAIVGVVDVTSCPQTTFQIGPLTIQTTSFTDFRKTTCGALVTGMNLKVRGVLLPGGTSAEATRVDAN